MRRLLALSLFTAACTGSGGAATETAPSTTTTTGETAATADTDTTSTGAPTTTAPTTTAAETSTSDTTGADADVPGCAGGSFLPVPKDTSLPGPWPVGARTVTIGGLTVEVWYPAELGSEAG